MDVVHHHQVNHKCDILVCIRHAKMWRGGCAAHEAGIGGCTNGKVDHASLATSMRREMLTPAIACSPMIAMNYTLPCIHSKRHGTQNTAMTLLRDGLLQAFSGSEPAKAVMLAVYPSSRSPVAATACLVPFFLDPAAALGRRSRWCMNLQSLALVVAFLLGVPAAVCTCHPPSMDVATSAWAYERSSSRLVIRPHVAAPPAWVADDRVPVGDSLQSSVICLLPYKLRASLAAAAAAG